MRATLVAAAIALCAHAPAPAKRMPLARIIATEAARRHVDPLLIVAIVEHESQWNQRATSRDREDFGLGQLRARYLLECSRDREPTHHPSRRCRRLQNRLLADAAFNLRTTVEVISTWRIVCKGSMAMAVAGYAGGRCKPLPQAGREILEAWASLRFRLHLPAAP